MSSQFSSGLALGLDASTQSLSAVLLDIATGKIEWSCSLSYREDPRLLGMGFEHNTLVIPPREAGEAEQPPLLFVAALQAILDDMKAAKLAIEKICSINVSGQQHGHVYLNEEAKSLFASLHKNVEGESLATILQQGFSYGGAPIWKTANTVVEANEIRSRAGGKDAIISRTGSDIPLRFSACAHRKIARRYPDAWAATCRIVQISSLIPAVLAGERDIPIDYGNACGTGIMNYQERVWDEVMLEAVAGDLPEGASALRHKLPEISHPLDVVGKIANWFVKRYRFSADCVVVAGSGDNPQSKVLASGDLLSLGTSFVYMMATPDGSVDMTGGANAMYDGLGRAFNFGCRTNGALVWDRLRQLHGLPLRDYVVSENALKTVPAGNLMRFWHPDSESFPIINASPNPVRQDDRPADFAHDFAGIVDSSLGLVYRYGQKIAAQVGENAKEPISVCGGPSASEEILKRIAAIWNRPAIQAGQAGAALGAAVAAAAATVPASHAEKRDELVNSLREKLFAGKKMVQPDPEMVKAYHAKGAYLDQLEDSFEKLRKV